MNVMPARAADCVTQESDWKTDAGRESLDSTFGMIMLQLFGALFQNSQRTALNTGVPVMPGPRTAAIDPSTARVPLPAPAAGPGDADGARQAANEQDQEQGTAEEKKPVSIPSQMKDSGKDGRDLLQQAAQGTSPSASENKVETAKTPSSFSTLNFLPEVAAEQQTLDGAQPFFGVLGEQQPDEKQAAECIPGRGEKDTETAGTKGHKMSGQPAPASEKYADPAKQVPNEKSGVHVPAGPKEGDAIPLQRKAVPDDRPGGNEGRQSGGQPIQAPVKPDFAATMQQPAAQHEAAHAAQSQGPDGTAGHVPARMPGADLAELLDHSVSIVKNGNRLAVQLEPDGLGKLDINLSLDKGIVNAQIHVADDATRNLIENNMQQIMNTLVGEGLSIGGFSVSLKQRGARDGTGERRQDDVQQAIRAAPRPVSHALPADLQGLVDLFV